MLQVNGLPILEDEITVLQELKNQLEINGIHRFNKIFKSGDNIMTNCPFHGNGQERKPSFGILTRNKGNRKSGSCHCFSCNWSGSFEEMVSNCFGKDDFGVFGTRWLVKNFQTLKVENRKDILLDFGRCEEDVSKSEFVSEEELEKYRYLHPYMYKRKLDNRVIEIFDIGYDRGTDCLTFPVRDIDGNCLFVARRSVKTKYFNYPESAQKPIYGLYELSKLERFPDEVYICESMLDCTNLWRLGKYAVALNGTGSDIQLEQLSKFPCKVFILATDNDKAGMSARDKLKKYLKNKLVYEVLFPKGRKDINECTDEEIENLEILFN